MSGAFSRKRIAIVEDEPEIAELVARTLCDHGFDVEVHSTAESFVARLETRAPDLAILDLGLPNFDGISLLPRLRAMTPKPAVIILSGRASDTDRIVGLELGADDYLAKPFNPRELVARVGSVLRRTFPSAPAVADAPRRALFADFAYDYGAMLLTAPDGAATMLSGSEARLLEAFLAAPNRVLTREHLLDQAAREDSLDRAIDVGVSRLRKRLAPADANAPEMIRTIYGAGYMFTSTVTWA